MYENRKTLQFHAQTMIEGLDLLHNRIAPILKRQAGLVNLCFVPNQHNHSITIITMWRTQMQAYAIETSCEYCRLVDHLEKLLLPPPPDEPEQGIFQIYHLIKEPAVNTN